MSEIEQRRVEGCIFCRIVAGEIPCHRLHEDERVLAFLDVGPLSLGHALVIPKAHYARLEEMPGELAAACMQVTPKLAKAILNVTGATAFNVLQNNGKLAHQEVQHVHFHIIPKTETSGLGIGWPAGKLAEDVGKDLRTKVVAAVEDEG